MIYYKSKIYEAKDCISEMGCSFFDERRNKMNEMYLLEGNKWLKVLGKKGFTWERGKSLLGSEVSIFEKVIDKKSSSAYVVDYAPDSPIRDSKKYIYYLSKCGNWNDLMKDIEDYKNKEN